MNYPEHFVSVAVGRKNTAGDWIIEDHEEVLAIDTGCSQIVITPSIRRADRSLTGKYNLTHVQSGYLLLRGFPTIAAARDAALHLARLFPIDQWDAVGAISNIWNRTRVKMLWSHLPTEEKLWMEQWGGPKVGTARS